MNNIATSKVENLNSSWTADIRWRNPPWLIHSNYAFQLQFLILKSCWSCDIDTCLTERISSNFSNQLSKNCYFYLFIQVCYIIKLICYPLSRE